MNVSQLVSVVITTYNRSDALLAVLRGLERQTDRDFEVIEACNEAGAAMVFTGQRCFKH